VEGFPLKGLTKEGNRLIILHKDSSNATITCVTFYEEGLGEIR